jgi:hypothetical protein
MGARQINKYGAIADIMAGVRVRLVLPRTPRWPIVQVLTQRQLRLRQYRRRLPQHSELGTGSSLLSNPCLSMLAQLRDGRVEMDALTSLVSGQTGRTLLAVGGFQVLKNWANFPQ